MYHCEFPGCDYSTESRTQIEYHHITPKSKGGKNDRSNRAWLCPNHHKKIYIPTEEKGIHSKQSEDSIILVGWMQSTAGRTLCWRKPDGPNDKHEDLFSFIAANGGFV